MTKGQKDKWNLVTDIELKDNEVKTYAFMCFPYSFGR